MRQGVAKANVTARGAGAPKKMLDSARYYTHRAGEDRDTRQWYDQDGQALSYEAVKAGIRTHAQAYTYSFRVVVSPGLEALGATCTGAICPACSSTATGSNTATRSTSTRT
jgi:hypothetical protein